MIVASAGHDTTKDAISGGLHALIANPAELDRLRAHPELMGTAVDEMIRWTTPGQGVHAHGDRRHRGAWRPDRQGRIGLPRLRVGQS